MQAECTLGFPHLWPALKATREHFAKEGITEKDLEAVEKEEGTRVAIIDGQLFGEYRRRAFGAAVLKLPPTCCSVRSPLTCSS